MPRLAAFLALASISLSPNTSSYAQQTGADRKTIEISATEKVQVPADIATIKVGCQNQAATKDAAYAENTRVANKIIQALLDAGVPKEAIETESLRLEQEQERFGAKAEQPPKYSASQEWQIYSKALEAQKIVDIAVAAGANQVENVEWSVSDLSQLDGKAYAAALRRAKEVAELTAAQTGLKLGEIVSVVNAATSFDRFVRTRGAGGMAFDKVPLPKMAMLKLQPGTVEREASVTITYSLVAP